MVDLHGNRHTLYSGTEGVDRKRALARGAWLNIMPGHVNKVHIVVRVVAENESV